MSEKILDPMKSIFAENVSKVISSNLSDDFVVEKCIFKPERKLKTTTKFDFSFTIRLKTQKDRKVEELAKEVIKTLKKV